MTVGEVSVLIVSNRSASLLMEAIRSIDNQDFNGPIHVAIVGDNPMWLPGDLPQSLPSGTLIDSFRVISSESFQALPTVERVARLRNAALAFVRGKYVCFLDDDNRWQSNHLSSLVELMRSTGISAVHSWRQLVDKKGDPWIPDRFPWGHDSQRSSSLYKLFVSAGVIDLRSNIFRDAIGLNMEGEIIDAVDMGAWLFDARIFDTLRFETAYTNWEVANSVTEDDKLLATIRRQNIAVACSKIPSLIYRLGGYSNTTVETPA